MGRIIIKSSDEVEAREFPRLAGVTGQGAIRSRGVIEGADRSVFFWMHELPAGAELRFEKPPVGHILYAWTGDFAVDGTPVETDGAAVVEHKAQATLRAGASGATLAHFHQRDDYPENPSRSGGRVHAVGSDGVFKELNEFIDRMCVQLADSTCETCELWLHRNHLRTPRPQVERHYHSEDEIIVVRRGGMNLGRRTLKPGTAVAIDAETIYSFGVPDEGFEFLNFRTKDPYYIKVGPDNKPLHAPIREWSLQRDHSMFHLAGTGESGKKQDYAAFGLEVPKS